jgi:hypothetical protein
MAATGAVRSPMLVPTFTSPDPKVAIVGAYIQMMQLENITEQNLLLFFFLGGGGVTLTAAEATLEASNVRLSIVLSSLIPSAFARIFTLLSFVETANSIPSLLNLIQGEACRISRPG